MGRAANADDLGHHQELVAKVHGTYALDLFDLLAHVRHDE
jgi:hypothetical protein